MGSIRLAITSSVVVLVLGCPMAAENAGSTKLIGPSPILPGIYVGGRECVTLVNGSESTNTDSISFVIDTDGLLVLSGQTIHVGLDNTFDTGAFKQSSIISSITVTSDGFTIDWDTVLTIDGAPVEGFVLESIKALDSSRFEFRSMLVVSTSGLVIREDCTAVLTR